MALILGGQLVKSVQVSAAAEPSPNPPSAIDLNRWGGVENVFDRDITVKHGPFGWNRLDVRGRVREGQWLGVWRRDSGADQVWRLLPSRDGSFQLRNGANSALCMDAGDKKRDWSSYIRYRPAKLRDCDSSNASQRWWLDPSWYGYWMIRNQNEPGQCLDVSGTVVGDVAKVENCSATKAIEGGQRWYIDDVPVEALKELAAVHALTTCASKLEYSTCDYDWTSVSSTSSGHPVCLLTQDNSEGETNAQGSQYSITYSEGRSVMTGDTYTTGFSFGVGVVFGNDKSFVHANVGSTFSWSLARSSQTTESSQELRSRQLVIPLVPAHGYGYVALVPRTKTYLGGRMVFNKGSWNEWSFEGDATVVLPISESDFASAGTTKKDNLCFKDGVSLK